MTIDIQKMKQRLEQKQVELLGDASNLPAAQPAADSVDLADAPVDMEEASVDATEMLQEQTILSNDQALLTEVREALQRIKDGTYGKCIDCGRPIPEKRLEALPWASRLVEHEAALERENLSRAENTEDESPDF